MPQYSPWNDAGSASKQIGNSLRQLTLTLAQRNMQQRMNQARLAIAQQAEQDRARLQQQQGGLYNAQMQHVNAQTQHQQSVDSAAKQYQMNVTNRAYPNPMQSGPTIEDAAQLMLARELGSRALVRGLGGNVDNPPTATINPGQERVNTLSGDVLGYLPPTPSFHSLPAGATPYILDQGQATVAGPQNPFRPMAPTNQRPIPVGLPSVLQNMTQYGSTNDLALAQQVMRALASNYTNGLPAQATNTNVPKRIRVQSPEGKTGTIEEGDQLPDGWKVIQ